MGVALGCYTRHRDIRSIYRGYAYLLAVLHGADIPILFHIQRDEEYDLV